MADPLHPYSDMPWMKLPNNGVPGDWVTGSRLLDVAVLPLILAALFPVLRILLVNYVFQPWAMSVFTRLQKKADTKWTQQQLDDKLLKWNESCWKAVVYFLFSSSAFLVAHREPWFLQPLHFWSGATQFPLDSYVPFKITAFYLLEIGFYIQAIPFLMFVEVRRKDWIESFAHHVVTLGLMYYSWWANFVRPGVMVMLLHDVSDIFLEGAKLARYAQRDDLAMKLFITFAGTWVFCRCVMFPYLVVGRMLVDPVTHVALPFNVNPQPHYAAFGTMFLSLFCLHLYWTYLIWRVIARQLRTGSTDDVREDDDD